MNYRICPDCGAALDPGEACDCEKGQNLPAIQCTQPPVIAENLDSVRSRLEGLVSQISSYPMDDDSLRKVKKLRADLRREFEQMEDQRMEVKKAVMKPYELANQKYKVYISDPYDAADKKLKEWVDDYQNGIKGKCEDSLRDYFNECCQSFGIDFLKFEDCGVDVDMALARQKEPRKAMDRIYDCVASVKADLEVIGTLEDSGEVLLEYMRCKSISIAIAEVNERRRAMEAAQSLIDQHSMLNEQQEKHRAELAAAAPEIGKVEEIYSMAFMATGTLAALKSMKANAMSLGITLEEINEEDKKNDK